MLDHVPPTIERYELNHHILEETWQLLAEPGREYVESVVLWLGSVPEATRATVVAAIRPPQIAYRSPEGLAVEVPQDVLTQLIASLPDGVHVLIRVHSHPAEAYHSATDDRNMIIGHVGAISVVVPHFATGPADLATCSINVLESNGRWRELGGDEVEATFTVR